MPSPGNLEQGRIVPAKSRAARPTDPYTRATRPWPIPPRATQPRANQARPVQPRVSKSLPDQTKPRAPKNYRNIKYLPLDMLTKEEKKKEWKRVLKAGSRSLADEFRLSIGGHDEEDYESKQRFGQFGGKAERLWACGYETRNSKNSRLSPTNTQSSDNSGSSISSSIKDTLKKARRSFKDECFFLWHAVDRKDFDMQRRVFGYHGGFEERLWNPIFA
ncbi:hypothetical protein QFC20_000024 [Naganishia adeliensis]|uniref:Uncharacterized protein n=1 Tax=Naganishia adeliensis TaxID=92952 RepID=A0ACC2X3X8_9TREE|nr:hypothetical protein QFC20_000024 [Naganishia adeliensis]